MYLIDTNILLRIFRQGDLQHQLIGRALNELERRGIEACFSLQNMAEFWNVCTRPLLRNGYGLSIADARKSAEYIESTMTLLPENDQVYPIWRQLAITHRVRGLSPSCRPMG
jgi:predicted nucleic acid-binding protein